MAVWLIRVQLKMAEKQINESINQLFGYLPMYIPRYIPIAWTFQSISLINGKISLY